MSFIGICYLKKSKIMITFSNFNNIWWNHGETKVNNHNVINICIEFFFSDDAITSTILSSTSKIDPNTKKICTYITSMCHSTTTPKHRYHVYILMEMSCFVCLSISYVPLVTKIKVTRSIKNVIYRSYSNCLRLLENPNNQTSLYFTRHQLKMY